MAKHSGKAYVLGKAGGVPAWVALRDYDKLQREGWVNAPDLRLVPSDNLVLEIDQDRFSTRVVGLATKPENVRMVGRFAGNAKTQANVLVRLRDIVDLDAIAERSGRSKSTIVGNWHKDETFPKPMIFLGGKAGWFWPDVAAWLVAKFGQITPLNRAQREAFQKLRGRKVVAHARKPDKPQQQESA